MVRCEAIPLNYSAFNSWLRDGSSSFNNSLIFNVSKNEMVTANFEPVGNLKIPIMIILISSLIIIIVWLVRRQSSDFRRYLKIVNRIYYKLYEDRPKCLLFLGKAKSGIDKNKEKLSESKYRKLCERILEYEKKLNQ